MPDVVRQYPINRPRPARLGSRHKRIIIPAPTVEAAAQQWVRLRSRVPAVEVVSGQFDAGVVVALDGTIWVAPMGTPGPVNATDALDPAFKNLGFVSEGGFVFRNGISVEPKSSWTSFYPAGVYINSRSATVSMALREVSRRNIEFALEGSVSGSGPYEYAPPDGDAVPKALVVDWSDGPTKTFRLYFPVGVVQPGDVSMNRTRATDLVIEYTAQKRDANPYTFYLAVPTA